MNSSTGQKIKILRKTRKLTQEQLAKQIGIKRATISNYEIDRRQPSLNDLKRIAEFFGVGLDYFGVAAKDEILDLLARSKRIFDSDEIATEAKENLYKEIMRLYLAIDKGDI